jgi:hypothetical protein
MEFQGVWVIKAMNYEGVDCNHKLKMEWTYCLNSVFGQAVEFCWDRSNISGLRTEVSHPVRTWQWGRQWKLRYLLLGGWPHEWRGGREWVQRQRWESRCLVLDRAYQHWHTPQIGTATHWVSKRHIG